MTEREMYLAMAKWLREHGFTHRWSPSDRCGCFARAAPGPSDITGHMPTARLRWPILLGVLGVEDLWDDTLSEAGWTEGCTDDAVAACLIAADLATETP